MRTWLAAAFAAIGAVALGWTLFGALSTGKLRQRGGRVVTRSKQPFSFWIAIGLSVILEIVVVGFAVVSVVRGLNLMPI